MSPTKREHFDITYRTYGNLYAINDKNKVAKMSDESVKYNKRTSSLIMSVKPSEMLKGSGKIKSM